MNIIVDHIPLNTACNRRPGIKMKPIALTWHSTQNPKSTAKNERGWLENPTNKRVASWHYAVDENHIVEAIPPNEVAWHAGDGNGNGNMRTISIEICESGDRAKTLANAAKLGAYLMKKHNITTHKRHYDWNGKICPKIMYDDGKWTGWTKFINQVMAEFNGGKVENKPVPTPTPSNSIPETYKIQKGDTFWGIAQKYKGLTVETITKLNPSVNPKTLQVGQVIRLKATAPVSKPAPAPKPATPKYPLPSGVLKRGSKGEAVKQLQRALNAVYFKVGAVDGSYGPATQDAVRRFQSMYFGLKVDGIYGPATREKLKQKLKEMNLY